MKHQPTDLPALLALIERYYDCALTDQEERGLRLIIARTDLVHPAIDEARALMGFRRHVSRRSRRSRTLRAVASVAAAVALVFVLGFRFMGVSGSGDSGYVCVAYANGERITDEEEVFRLIARNLHEMRGVTELEAGMFKSEMGDIAPLIDSFETISVNDNID